MCTSATPESWSTAATPSADSTAIPERNIERDEAGRVGVPSLHRSGMLASICARAKSLAVAGTHGKTTTTSMLMLILAEAGLRPSFVIGGDVTDMGTGAQWTGGEWFVVEADESDGTHLTLPLYGTILTNVEVDHLDYYGTEEAIVEGFDRYLAQIDGPKVVCLDDAGAARLAARHDVITYGTSPAADFVACNVAPDGGAFAFDVVHQGINLGTVSLPLRGLHNVRNATGAIALAVSVGVSFEVAAAALAKFGGVARRFDIRGVDGGATLVDDYGHLPTEIAAVLAAARNSGDDWQRVDRRLPAQPLQPHRGDVAGLRRRVHRRRHRGAHRDLRVGHGPDPRHHRQAAGERRAGCAPSCTRGLAAPSHRPDRVPLAAAARRRCLHLDGLRRRRHPSRRSAAAASRAPCGPTAVGTMIMAEPLEQAQEALAEFATADEPLAPYTTYKVGGAAAVFASPRNDEDLRRIAEVVAATGLPTLVVGRGSNLLVADSGFAGIAISLASMAEWIEFHGTVVHAGAAVALPVLARRCVAAGLAGFEWAVGVPGSVGGAVRMNAGGHGSDMAACLIGVHVLDLHTAHHGWVDVAQLGLHFRGSQLADHQVVLDARLQLREGDVATGEAELSEIVRWRRENQPGGQNAGSVFVNPIPGELPAAPSSSGEGSDELGVGRDDGVTVACGRVPVQPLAERGEPRLQPCLESEVATRRREIPREPVDIGLVFERAAAIGAVHVGDAVGNERMHGGPPSRWR